MLTGFASALLAISLFGSTTIHSYICAPPSAPSIASPSNGTSVVTGTPFIVSGIAEPNASIILSDNGVDVVALQADETNHYQGSMTAIASGSHTISARAERSCGSTVGSSVTVVATTSSVVPIPPISGSIEEPVVSPPSNGQDTPGELSLVIVSPKNNVTTTESSVFIDGYTSKIATVTITVNGETVASTYIPRTFFGMSVPLEIGENTVVISAASTTGTASTTLTVFREQPAEKNVWHQTKLVRAAALLTVIGSASIVAVIGIMRRYRRVE
jgi:hypothetical protein